jgi:HEAT repeat protein
MRRFQRNVLLAAILVSTLTLLARASKIDDLVTALAGKDDQARSLARQLLPREGVDVVPRLLPLLRQDNAAVRDAVFNVLADVANDASAPGRDAARAKVTAYLMRLLEPDQPASIKLQGLRLIPIVIPPDGDVGPIASLLADRDLRERARQALEEIATPASRTALREHLLRGDLAQADPDFAAALLNSLGRLHDRDSVDLIVNMTQGGNSRVRAAAARALAWTGDPVYLKSVQMVVAAADPTTRPDAQDALLRLLDAMGQEERHGQVAAAGYRELITSTQGPVKDGALAGLGRVGDASSVPAILAAIRESEPPTLLVGMDALRTLPGADVSRALVAAYPTLPPRAQAAMIPILGSRREPVVLPILEQAAHSELADRRVAALEALGDTGLTQALNFLAEEAKRGDDANKSSVRDILNRHAQRELEKLQRSLAEGSRDADLMGLLGIIGRWWVVGPFDLGDKNQGWETSYIGEPNVNVVARYMAGKTRRQWKRVESQDSHGKIDLRATIADRDSCIGYAYAEIELQKPADAVLLLGVDDSEKIWVNGDKVFEQFTARGLVFDQDRVPVHLKAGTNSILLKLYQNTQGWEFCVRIVTPEGHPVQFTQKAE